MEAGTRQHKIGQRQSNRCDIATVCPLRPRSADLRVSSEVPLFVVTGTQSIAVSPLEALDDSTLGQILKRCAPYTYPVLCFASPVLWRKIASIQTAGRLRRNGGKKVAWSRTSLMVRFTAALVRAREWRLLRWARVEFGVALPRHACREATKDGDRCALLWLRDQGCRWDASLCYEAVRRSDLALLQWLRRRRCPWDTLTCSAASQLGHTEILKWALDAQCPYSYHTWMRAVDAQDADMMETMKRNKACEMGTEMCAYAADKGSVLTLVMLRALDYPCDVTVCAKAAHGGYLIILEMLRNAGCPWDSSTCYLAADGGHLETLRWAHEHGCPMGRLAARRAAERRGHMHVVEWIDAQP